MEYEIRNTIDSDISLLLPYIAAEFEAYDIPPDMTEAIISSYKSDISFTIIVDEIPVGVLLMNNYSKKNVNGILFYLFPTYRGTRLNYILRNHTFEYIKSLGFKKITAVVLSNLRTHNYWKRFGFTTTNGTLYEMHL